MELEWFECAPDYKGIHSIAYEADHPLAEIARAKGYNGITKGDAVEYEGVPYIVVLVSRLGFFGLAEEAGVIYSEFVRPDRVTKIPR